jgi:hypothetical protein
MKGITMPTRNTSTWKGITMSSTYLSYVKNVLAGVLFLAIFGFALCSMGWAQSWFAPVKTPANLQAADDPVRNGLKIVEKRVSTSVHAPHHVVDTPAMELLNDWSYTSKGKPSPYH